MSKFIKLKEKALTANLALDSRLSTLYSRIHLSVLDRELGVFAIRPHAKALSSLKADDMVVVDLMGAIVDGGQPTRDFGAHLHLYNSFKEIGSVCSSHTPYATAWAQSGRSIPVYGMGHAMQIPCDVPIVPLLEVKELEGGEEYHYLIAKQIVKLYSSSEVVVDSINFAGFMSDAILLKVDSALYPLEVPMVLVAGDGAYLWGEDYEDTIRHARVLEELAQTAFLSESLNHKINRLPQSLVEYHYERKYKNNQYYKKDDE